MLEATHSVYGLKGITAIPLDHDRANIVINTLAARNIRPSLLPSTTMDTIGGDKSAEIDDDEPHVQFATAPPPREVQFSPNDQVKVMTPDGNQQSFHQEQDSDHLPSPSPSTLSGSSTPSESASPVQPIAKALAARLSFWSRLNTRSSLFPSSSELTEPGSLKDEQPSAAKQSDAEDLDALLREEKGEPKEVLDKVLSATAPPPETAEEKHTELEDKVVKEIIREFVKGGMYFSYNFGMCMHFVVRTVVDRPSDITRSLQHKQDQVLKSQKQDALLADLIPSRNSSELLEGEKINALSEPYPTLPLWRRVDKQFWWNEWMSKPFIDAGVCSHSYLAGTH